VKSLRIILLLIVIITSADAKSQTVRDRQAVARVKAIYIYNFASLTSWPKEYKQGNFTIGVYGSKYLYEELKANYSSRKIGLQPIITKQFNSLAELGKCHIIYVDESKTTNLATVVRKQKNNSVLIVTENEGALKIGSIINFVQASRKQSYELSKNNGDKRRLVFGKTLIDLAKKVDY